MPFNAPSGRLFRARMDTKPILSEISFGSTMIQKLRRISLDPNLLRTLGLQEGDDLEVALIVETGEIRLRRSGPPLHATKTLKSR